MKNQLRKEIINLINTLIEGISLIERTKNDVQIVIIEDSTNALYLIYNLLKESLSETSICKYNNNVKEIILYLTKTKDLIYKKDRVNKYVVKILKLIYELKELLLIENVKYEVLFLPYKASMWDSLESIWLSAKDDPNCECFVMPIPYYERNPDLSIYKYFYEGNLFPDYVPITNYDSYGISQRKPDIIYIHNPFDGNNLVTTVDPQYYSSNLKLYSDMLVYVPYGIPYITYNDNKEIVPSIMLPYIHNVNKIITYSKVTANHSILSGYPKNKLCILGSPKFDFVKNYKRANCEIPIDWRNKIHNKMVFLFNTSIRTMLNMNERNEWISYIKNIVNFIIDEINDGLIIWRPHPLLEATIRSMRNEYYDEYIKLKEKVINSAKGIYDDSSDYRISFSISDALISDISSISSLYLATGKPIYINDINRIDMKKFRFVDFSECVLNDDMDVNQFVVNVISGKYKDMGKRLESFKNSVINSDGTCGEKIHNYILGEIQDE